MREWEDRGRRSWKDAVPLEGSRADILSFPLFLSVGDIGEDGIGPARREVRRRLYPTWEGADGAIEKARENWSVLMERAGRGEPVRVWSSSDPDEACGLYWLAEQLRPVGFEGLDMTVVALPELHERADGTLVQYDSWGEVELHQFGRLAQRGRKLSAPVLQALACRWCQLREENAPLRAVVNGRLMSVPESLYDPFLLQLLAAQPDEFHEGAVIGGGMDLRVGDGWLAQRLERMIQDGLLEPVTQASPDAPAYARMLRKCAALDAGPR